MIEFQECDTCKDKPGSPMLCSGCLHNRRTIQEAVTTMNFISVKLALLISAIRDVKGGQS